MQNIKIAKKYIKHWFTSRNSKGFGIHSPFLHHLVTEIIHDYTPFYCYDEIEFERNKLLTNNTTITVEDFGSGSRIFKSKQRIVKDIARISLKPKKHAQLLFRLINHFESKNILEIGTSFGISTSYLAKVSKASNVVTLEGCSKTAEIAQTTFNNLALANISLVIGPFEKTLSAALKKLITIDFVFFDGNHSEQATLNYFEQCLPFINNKTLFVFDDIYLNEGMENVWKKIKKSEHVTATLDLFHMGIVIFRKELTKEHFKVHF
ncbi:MAG: class I SAM-dependent methyltransferase [Salinivirgaceae bacterium]|nr:class I SAM-dependent methyltransferase [Salinivirgaceae bacterium]